MDFRFEFIREKNDLTQSDVARKLKIGIRNYNLIESEKANIKLRKLNDYCNLFNCSMDYVARLSDSTLQDKPIIVKSINKSVMAQRLNIIEQEQNIEAQQLAKDLGVAPSTYCDYKRTSKKNLMQSLMLKTISQKYGYSMDWIVGRSDNKFRKH